MKKGESPSERRERKREENMSKVSNCHGNDTPKQNNSRKPPCGPDGSVLDSPV